MSGWAADPYVYPGTRVLRNRLDIRDPARLARLDADLSALALAELADQHLPGRYDLLHVQGFHQVIFGVLYPWAGQIRTVMIAKPGSLFALPHQIHAHATEFATHLADQRFLRGLDRAGFIDRLAPLWDELDRLHPFRDGNGRAIRAMLGQLALDADHHLSWARLDRQANLDAALAGTLDDHLPRRALLAGLVDVDDTGRVLTPTALRGLLAAIRTRHTTGPPPPHPGTR